MSCRELLKKKKKSKNSHQKKKTFCDQTSIIRTNCYIALAIIANSNVGHSFKKAWTETEGKIVLQ